MTEDKLSHLAHAALALGLQAVIGCLFWLLFSVAPVLLTEPVGISAMLGGLIAIGFYWGREVAQVERHAGVPPWWSGFNPRNWKADNWGDFLFPLVACVAAVLAVCFAVG